MRCERCDRPKAALKSNDYDPAFCWTVDIGTDMPLNWRRFKPSPLDDCHAHTVDWRTRCLAAEAQLARVAESGTGYSQQTMDAIVNERDALRYAVKYAYDEGWADGRLGKLSNEASWDNSTTKHDAKETK